MGAFRRNCLGAVRFFGILAYAGERGRKLRPDGPVGLIFWILGNPIRITRAEGGPTGPFFGVRARSGVQFPTVRQILRIFGFFGARGEVDRPDGSCGFILKIPAKS